MAMIALLVLQAVQVVFLWLHDWVPVGRLNDVEAVRRADPLPRLVLVTLVQSMPYTAGLVFSLMFYRSGGGLPGWVWSWLWISYGLLFAGELRAWWVPYLVRPEPARAVRYRAMFGRTHAFLPERNGISPNTLHCAACGNSGDAGFIGGAKRVGPGRGLRFASPTPRARCVPELPGPVRRQGALTFGFSPRLPWLSHARRSGGA